MKVSEIIEIKEKARRENKIPCEPKKDSEFKKIFDKECEKINGVRT